MNELFLAVLDDVWKDKQKDSLTILKNLSKEIQGLQEKKERFMDLAADGTITKEDYRKRTAKIDIEIIAKETERSDYKEVASTAEHYLALAETLLNNVAVIWQEAPFEYQQRFQELVFPNGVTYQDGSIGTAEIGLPFNLIPTSAEPKDLLVSREGVEPPTNALRGHCSAIELPARIQFTPEQCFNSEKLNVPEYIVFRLNYQANKRIWV